MTDMVTFTISLPVSARFDEYLLALRAARHQQHLAHNPAAAEALCQVISLAGRGLIAWHEDRQKSTIPGVAG